MAELPDNSIHAVCTSPPYWGLRKYSGEQDLIWGDNHCEHEWEELIDKSEGYTSRKRWQHTGGREGMPDGGFGYDIKNSNTCSLCGSWKGAYGLEPTPEMYVQHTIEILREIRRVLRKDGVVFWNIGDSYASGKGTCFNPSGGKGSFSTHGDRKDAGVYPLDRGNVSMLRAAGLKPLDLCLIPERLAIALQEDGWWVRSIIIWHKANPMPESVNGWRWERHRIKIKNEGRGKEASRNTTAGRPQQDHNGREYKPDAEWKECPGCSKCSPNDGLVLRKGSWRPTDSYEQILMLTKTANYYCDAEAVREAYSETVRWGGDKYKGAVKKGTHGEDAGLDRERSCFPNNGRNLRNVWSFPTKPFPDAHFAVFPEKLPELCIKAATPEVGVCAECGAPWARVVEKGFSAHDGITKSKSDPSDKSNNGAYGRLALLRQAARERGFEYVNDSKTIGWRPTCSCNCPDTVPATVLDNFAGAGTTLKVAVTLGRNAVGYELSSKYCDMINKRVDEVQIKYSR